MNRKTAPKKMNALPIRLSSEEEKWGVLLLVLLRLTELCEKWKRSRPKGRPRNPEVEKAGVAAEKALQRFARLVLSKEDAAL